MTVDEQSAEWPGHFLQLNEAERQASWPEDFAKDKDNGAYLNICCCCNGRFVGHKRRVRCLTCRNDYWKAWERMPLEDREKLRASEMEAIKKALEHPDTT